MGEVAIVRDVGKAVSEDGGSEGVDFCECNGVLAEGFKGNRRGFHAGADGEVSKLFAGG